MKKLLFGAMLVVLPVTALHAMTVATFLQKAEALEKRGATALFSSDLRLLKREVEGATKSLKEERLAAERAGRRGAYCPPQQGGSMNSRELLDHFRAIPAPQRERTEVKDAMRSLLARKFPCPA
ncbi:MAG: hypothetical protein ACK4K7_04405 [Allosphingosinicella sp.]|uniref:hypothetical protein n=1 Tax=Allosphingosinicella sp. TaxID=2823234 RepID=UPI003935FFDE